jgi:hypothetical protein
MGRKVKLFENPKTWRSVPHFFRATFLPPTFIATPALRGAVSKLEAGKSVKFDVFLPAKSA